MEKPGTSTSDEEGMCKLCKTQRRRYTCPKCEIPYCSLDCYKSEEHSECSESFYRDWVETELKSQEQDPEARQKMIDILKRLNDSDLDFHDDPVDGDEEFVGDEDPLAPIDSDDDEDVPDLADRLKTIDLNNADELWAALTDAERQEFEANLRNGEATKFLPRWVPWWSDDFPKTMIQEIKDGEYDVPPDYAARCPPAVDVPTIKEITKASPLVIFNLTNVLHAYAYTVLHCNGEHLDSAGESVDVFLRLSENIRSNKVFEDSERATESVAQNAVNCQSLPGDEEAMAATRQAVNLITNGPDDSAPNFYVTACLSDLHRLFEKAKNENSESRRTDKTFTKKFRPTEADAKLSEKTLFRATKKIEYYLSWIKSHETRIFLKNV